jgi:hypothetical protein
VMLASTTLLSTWRLGATTDAPLVEA